MRRLRGRLLLGILATVTGLAGLTWPASGQQPGVRAVEVLSLGPDDRLLEDSRVLFHPAGLFLVGPVVEPGRIAVYGRDGAFLRYMGRRGSGPGEITAVDQLFLWPGDSVAVTSGLHVHLFSPDGGWGRSFISAGLVREAARLGDSVITYQNPSFNRGAPPLVLLKEGAPEVMFGEDLAGSWAKLAAGDSLVAAVIAREDELRVRLYTPAGEQVQEYGIGAPWLRPFRRHGRSHRGGILTGVSVRGDTLWILSLRRIPEAVPAPDAPAPGGEGPARRRSLDERRAIFEPRLYAVHMESGRVLARAPWPGRVPGGFAGENLAFTIEDGPSGLPTITIWALRAVHASDQRDS